MSSEDEYYNDRYDYRYDRYSSKKTRRRGSSPRRRQFGSDCFHRKSRRNKHRNNNHCPRLAAITIILILIVYEVVILSVSSSESTSIVHETNENEHTANPVPNTWHKSSAPDHSNSQPTTEKSIVEPQTGSTSHAKTNSVGYSTGTGSNNVQSNAQSSSGQTDGGIVQNAPISSSSGSVSNAATNTNSLNNSAINTSSHRLPESAIKMEAKGADEDPDIDSRSMRRRRPSHSRFGHSGTHDSKTAESSSPDKGAEPGAGENFWNWFQETKGSDKKGSSKSLPCPEDHKRLCQMFYKYLRKYKIRRIFDVSCEKNYEWMGDILKKAGNELWGFKYYCSLWDGEKAQHAREVLGGLPFVEFDDAKWWRAGFASDTELLFAWDTLAHLAYGRVWNFFVKARKQDVKYILVDNYPGILNDPSPKRDYLNLRKHPFRFPSAKEVAQNVTEPGETSKRQLLFYETAMLPENLQ